MLSTNPRLVSLAIAAFLSLYPLQVLGENVVVLPRPAEGPLDNPLKGWCPYTNAGEIHQPYSMVFQDVSWRELEPTPNEFRFEKWERSWQTEVAKGKHIVFRVWIDYPKRPSGLPDWLRTAGVKETVYSQYGGGSSPDYNDPRIVTAMERLIAALGKRYNNHPRIAFIQLGLLGFWGEWHTYPLTKLYASTATERRIIDAYREAFPNKSLMVRYARDYAGEQGWIGFHDDMFPEDTDNGKDWSFLAGIRKARRDENWKGAVVGGEMVPGEAERWVGENFDTTLEMLGRSHFSWVGPYCPALEARIDSQFRKRCETLVRKMGYEFQITEVSHPTTLSPRQPLRVSLVGKNVGVAPFYYPWSVEWVLLDSSNRVVSLQKTGWDIRKWLPGRFAEDSELAFEVAPGKYQLGIGIRDPWKDRPAIHFANHLPSKNGWTILSEIRVSD